MSTQENPRQLVLRRDTATGIAQVGWERDLPIGRFQHIELVCELEENLLPDIDHPHFANYQAACMRAREANHILLQQQHQRHKSQGWWFVPFELSSHTTTPQEDEFGNYQHAAMQLLFELTHNQKKVWAVAHDDTIIHVRSRQPEKSLDELSYQVWRHQQLHQLGNINGESLEGSLLACESGLWFIPAH